MSYLTSRVLMVTLLWVCTPLLVAAAAREGATAPFRRVGWIEPSSSSAGRRTRQWEALRGGHSDGVLGSPAADRPDEEDTRRLVIIIDVDNTLYSEQSLVSSTGAGIESQIVRNTHIFGQLHLNLTSEECDALYRQYGSTVEGLRHTLPPEQVEDVMGRFYREVYDPIDFSCMLGAGAKRGFANDNEGDLRSGYDHGQSLRQRQELASFLGSICKAHTVYLASNSPRAHITRVINGMGLASVNFAGILSPDADDIMGDGVIYPTKSSPEQYYKSILDRYSTSSNRIILLDDSLHNLRAAETVGIEGIYIGQEGRTLEEGLAEARGHIRPRDAFAFSDVEYLRAKNRVDANAINPSVWTQLAQQLGRRLQESGSGTLRIADLGAGLLSMLQLLVEGGGKKPSMLALTPSVAKLEYFAYESNQNLFEECKETMRSMGFNEINGTATDDCVTFLRTVSGPAKVVEITVQLHPTDFQREENPPEGLDLIIGCCFADLFDPDELVLSLHRFARGGQPPLVYFPITFGGTTQFDPAFPATGSESTNSLIPSDTTAFKLYAESLAANSHNLDPTKITEAFVGHGGSFLVDGSSNWVIDPSFEPYLWETMLYFFGMTGAREMTKRQLDAAGWIRRCRSHPRTIIVTNVDLLFQLEADTRVDERGKDIAASGSLDTTMSVKEIQFVAPCNVTAITKRWETADPDRLAPDQVEIESLCSLISSGTELKVFKGSFDSAILDVNIKGMADKAMEYPLAYGYSLVGRIVACGSNVDPSLIGRLAFAFSPHSSRVIVDRDAMQLVPNGIDAEDAIFMPSVETALSLVHDAHVRLGEKVAVYGQGIIGLLVTSILSMQTPSLASSLDSTITVFDALVDRLAVASSLGATSALKPNAAPLAGPFDVSIEVSGNARALQSAIDHTANHGRVIVGSWYGDAEIALKLGLDFHRSHKTIQTSQVSTIPPALAGLWSKERRFDLAWELVRSIRPSKLITKQLELSEAQRAYELLDEGKALAIFFVYPPERLLASRQEF
ncbi:hypothetical protein ACHAXT_004609 [Thalassiosira profunda]